MAEIGLALVLLIRYIHISFFLYQESVIIRVKRETNFGYYSIRAWLALISRNASKWNKIGNIFRSSIRSQAHAPTHETFHVFAIMVFLYRRLDPFF